ncbi:MAG: hypothetical protein H7061_00135, partial [Bdellovibrionaceae bacterium]|nr:hypothetical protein [Bdellovibrio sp.]
MKFVFIFIYFFISQAWAMQFVVRTFEAERLQIVDMEGEIFHDDEVKLKYFLRNRIKDDLNTVFWIRSSGGFIVTAIKIGDSIAAFESELKKNKASLYTFVGKDSTCASACLVIFTSAK